MNLPPKRRGSGRLSQRFYEQEQRTWRNRVVRAPGVEIDERTSGTTIRPTARIKGGTRTTVTGNNFLYL